MVARIRYVLGIAGMLLLAACSSAGNEGLLARGRTCFEDADCASGVCSESAGDAGLTCSPQSLSMPPAVIARSPISAPKRAATSRY